MGSSTERILSTTLLELSSQKSLSKITLKEILETSHVSKSSFYNSFRDINDLIYYTFQNRIVDSSWDMLSSSYEDYYLGILMSLKKMKKNRQFCLDVYDIVGQSSPKDAIIRYSMESEIRDLKEFFPMESHKRTPELIASFYSYGTINTMFDWLKHIDTASETAEELARAITDSRFALIACFLKNDKLTDYIKKHGNPQFVK